MVNGRVFYACLGVLVNKPGSGSTRFGRNDQEASEDVGDFLYLNGVQSVGVSSDFVSQSLVDVGRFQRRFNYYSPQTFEITIERVIDQSSEFFYSVNPSDYSGGIVKDAYENTHILNPNNIGPCGEADSSDKSLKNYDIAVLYGSDDVDLLTDNTSDIKVVTYRNCLVTNISYTISANDAASVRESITLITRTAEFNEIAENELPLPSSAEDGNIIKRSDFDLLATTGGYSILPTEVQSLFGSTPTLDGESIRAINNIEINATINYSEVSDIGSWKGAGHTQTPDGRGYQNLYRYVVLPVEITCAFTGTLRNPYERTLYNTDTTFSRADGATGSANWNKVNKKIRLVAEKFPSPPTSTYFVWDLGGHNYLTNISYAGGDATGGNTEATMTYQNDYSDFLLVKDTSVRSLDTIRDYIY